MTEQFDIFYCDHSLKTTYGWVHAATCMVAAKERVRELSIAKPGEYMIFDQKEQVKTFIDTRLKAYSASRT